MPQALKVPETAALTPTRVNEGDLTRLAEWLLWRLKGYHGDLTDQTLAGWLRGSILNNEIKFLRCERAIGFFEIVHKSVLDPVPMIREVFLYIQVRDDGMIDKSALPEAMAIYQDVKRWAQSIGAQEIEVDRDTDLPQEFIEQVLGKLTVRKRHFAKVKP